MTTEKGYAIVIYKDEKHFNEGTGYKWTEVGKTWKNANKHLERGRLPYGKYEPMLFKQLVLYDDKVCRLKYDAFTCLYYSGNVVGLAYRNHINNIVTAFKWPEAKKAIKPECSGIWYAEKVIIDGEVIKQRAYLDWENMRPPSCEPCVKGEFRVDDRVRVKMSYNQWISQKCYEAGGEIGTIIQEYAKDIFEVKLDCCKSLMIHAEWLKHETHEYKFEVGDRVRIIKKYADDGKRFSFEWNKYVGKIGTIEEKQSTENITYKIKLDCCQTLCMMRPEWFEKIDEYKFKVGDRVRANIPIGVRSDLKKIQGEKGVIEGVSIGRDYFGFGVKFDCCETIVMKPHWLRKLDE